ncbi:MAG TPA: nuclear transport factor 2 family protein [Bauldia sp.]|nr:nuclear transport factor 2 family protein [Bauldia sp.]
MTEAEKEIRRDFDDWFRDAARKDLDAVMTRIAPDIVSYEHDAPLVYRGADSVREVCRRGFDAMPGKFRWDIPDLQIVVRDDLAITWGLNRMSAELPEGGKIEMWSRGTRAFRKIDGKWMMIHQHVSFPYDPATGQARLDLKE